MPNTILIPTQEDRDAATDYLVKITGHSNRDLLAKSDDHALVQAFARHRLTALEEAAKVEADLREALSNSRQAVQAFLDMVNVIQRVQALPIPSILETAQHNCPIILDQIDLALSQSRETGKKRDGALASSTTLLADVAQSRETGG